MNNFFEKITNLLNNFKVSCLTLFTISSCIQLFIFNYFPISLSIDSYAYINGYAEIHPHGYDFLLDIFGIHYLDSFVPIIIFQMLLTSFTPVLIYCTFSTYNRKVAFIVSLAYCFNFYTYILSLQIMSEATFIFGLVLIIFLFFNYFKKSTFLKLVCVCFTILCVSEIRPSANVLFVSLITIIVFLLSEIRKKYLVYHFIFATLFFVSSNYMKALKLNRSSIDLAPYFMMHYMPLIDKDKWSVRNLSIKKNEAKPFLNSTNGPRSQQFYAEVQKLFQLKKENKDYYYEMASKMDSRGTAYELIPEFKVKNFENMQKLIIELQHNYKEGIHKWPRIISHMKNEIGWKKTGYLLRGLIFEAMYNEPEFFHKFLLPAFTNSLLRSATIFPDVIYWSFVPPLNTNDKYYLLNLFPMGHEAYASWIFNQEVKTGNDKNAKIDLAAIYGHEFTFKILSLSHQIHWFKDYKISPIYSSYNKQKNYTAFGIYLSSFFSRNLTTILVLISPILILLSMFSKPGIVSIIIGLSGYVMILVSFMTALGPRQIYMFIPMLFPIFFSGINYFLYICFNNKNNVNNNNVN